MPDKQARIFPAHFAGSSPSSGPTPLRRQASDSLGMKIIATVLLTAGGWLAANHVWATAKGFYMHEYSHPGPPLVPFTELTDRPKLPR